MKNQVTYLILLLLVVSINSRSQVFKPQPNITPSWKPYIAALDIPYPPSYLASPYDGNTVYMPLNLAFQNDSTIILGRFGKCKVLTAYDSCGIHKTPFIDSFEAADGFVIDSNLFITPFPASPCASPTNIYRSEQYIRKVINTNFGAYFFIQSDSIVSGLTSVYKKVGTSFVNLFPNLPWGASITDVRDFGDGQNLALTGSFDANSFSEPGTWHDHVLYNPITLQFTPWDTTNMVFGVYTQHAFSTINTGNDTTVLLEYGPSSFHGTWIHFIKKNVNGVINNAVTGGTPIHIINGNQIVQVIKTAYFSKNNIYILWKDLFDFHISHYNGSTFVTDLVPPSPDARFMNYNLNDSTLYTNFFLPNTVHFKPYGNPVISIPNMAAQDSMSYSMEVGMWYLNNGEYMRKANYGLPGNLSFLFEKGYKLRKVDTPIISFPTEGQVFPSGTTNIPLTVVDDYEYDIAYAKDHNTGISIGNSTCDPYGNATINLTYATSGTKSVDVYLKDPNGNIGPKVTRSFIIANATNVNDFMKEEGIVVLADRIHSLSPLNVTLYDLNSKIISQENSVTEFRYPSHITSGLYIVRFDSKNQSSYQKIFIAK